MAGKTAILSVRITGDGRDARRELDRTASSVDRLTNVQQKLDKGTAATSKFVGKMGLASVALGGVGVAAIGALGAVGGLGAAVTVLALGMDGIKKAAGAAAPAFNNLKSAVSSTFATEMVPGFEALGRVMTSITPQMQGVASSISGLFNGVAGTLENATGGIQMIADGASQFITALGPGLNTLIDGFIGFGAQASASAGQVGGAFSQLLASVGTALQDLPVDQIMSGFSQAISGLAQFIGPVIGLLGQLAAVVGPVLGQAFSTLGPVITQISGPLSQIAQVIGQALIIAIQALAPVIPPIVDAFASIFTAIAPLLPPLGEIIAMIGSALAQAIQLVAPIIVKLADALGPVLRGAVAILKPALDIAIDAFSLVADAISTVVGWIRSLINWISNIDWPSPPSWLTGLFGAVPTAFPSLIGVPRADSILRFLPPVPFMAAAAMPEITAADPGNPFATIGRLSSANVQNTTINVQIDGALDPIAVGAQVEDVLRKYARATGGSVAFQLGGVS